MKATEFCYWLQGLFELSDEKTLNQKQVETIKNHLKLVFLYEIDPSYTEDPNLQKIFQNIHDGKKPFEGVELKEKPQKTGTFQGYPNRIAKC